MNAEIAFRARVQDLSKAARLVLSNGGAATATDFVDFLVSECIATVRSVGSSTEIPVEGVKLGTARIPFVVFEKIAGIARSFGKSEAQVTVTDGKLQIGSWNGKNEAITIGTIPDQTIDLPVNACTIDTLALAELLTPEQIIQQGLHRRVELARDVASEAITKAEAALNRSLSRENKYCGSWTITYRAQVDAFRCHQAKTVTERARVSFNAPSLLGSIEYRR